ncbi:MAG: type I methionyl aminopeptidase [Patescibacteria group bacterium]|nr:type I methionyl aminopeptidase [Patescibacteria group bacterium]
MIIIKTEKEIAILRQGGRILSRVLDAVADKAEPGATTGELEQLAVALIEKAGGRPSFKKYKAYSEAKAFPTALCASINDEVVHAPALPSRKLNAGDIIGIDVGMEYPYGDNIRGYFTDMAKTVAVGKISQAAKNLMKATRKSLMLAIEKIKPGCTLNDIGSTIQEFVEAKGFSVVRDLVGHGVGIAVHEDPQIPNYSILGSNFKNIELKPGMVIAIEPMINIGSYKIKSLPDGLTIATADGSLSAHFEHTIAVTEAGHEVLTLN